ncbi:hypothetical protein Cgig2_025725 [Carnegiea gigantea]|uniref:Uncharacterized protein n=1 Tax=Carnegiea gigantea TaxID=171969 RepID=A0A9Q1Q5K1_9CARY|nr:hypothetical protein Cgig2_025725 [Carnegiea gigantea]
MDKNREVRRCFNRPNKKQHYQHQLISGSGAEESSREKKLRRLSSVADMGSDGGAEDELGSSTASPRKFKFPRKIFGDSNTVDSASVPRKLRSAIRKRGCEPASAAWPGAKRLNNLVNGIEPLRKDVENCILAMLQNGYIDHSAKPAASVPISRDEEEVAETLFALAGMIPLSDLDTRNKTDCEPSESKALDLAEKPENSMPVSGGFSLLLSSVELILTAFPLNHLVPKEEQEITCYPASAEAAIVTPTANSSPTKSVQEESLTGPAPLSWPQLSGRRPMNLNLKVSVPPVNLLAIPPLLRTCDQRPLINSNVYCTSTEPSAQNGSSAIIFPSWLDTAACSSRLATCKDLSTEKLSCSVNGTRTSWKRCAAHVYISRLIRVLQISEGKGTWTLDASQLRPSQTLGGSHIMPDHSNIVRNRANGTLRDSNLLTSADRKTSDEDANTIPVTHQHHQEQQEGPSFSGYCGSKESFDFLSLSSGVTLAADNDVNRSGYNMESGVKCQMHYQHSVAQHSRPIPSSSPQNHFPSNSYRDRVAPVSVGMPCTPPQGNLHVPQYFGNPFAPGPMFNTTMSVQQPQRKQQQRQQIWTAQLAKQFGPGPLLSSQIANWQNGRKDTGPSTHTEALLPSSQPPREELRAKYLHISQQPQLIAISQSLGPTRANRQHIQLPSSREDSGNQLCPNGALPLQLTLQ